MDLDCESELTPLLSTRLKEPIHSGAKFCLKSNLFCNVGKSPVAEVSCLNNLIQNVSRILLQYWGTFLNELVGSYFFVKNSALIVEL